MAARLGARNLETRLEALDHGTRPLGDPKHSQVNGVAVVDVASATAAWELGQLAESITGPCTSRSASTCLGGATSTVVASRSGLWRLVRYALRSPLAKGRLSQERDGMVVLGMKRAWSDGPVAVRFDPVDFVAKLAALVPPPRVNQTLYKGVLAANSAWRAEVVPKPREVSREERLARKRRKLARKPRWQGLGWADLLERVFAVDAFQCKRCGGRLHLRCVVVNPPATTRILRGLFGSRAPP